MNIIEIIFLSIGLAMDAFAVSICKGLSIPKMDIKKGIITGVYFGGFQALMPLLGYFLGVQFEHFITSIDHFIVFGLLFVIGGNMILEALKPEKEEQNNRFDFKTMLPLALATSVDALAVGISLAFLQVNIWIAITFIGIITFTLSFLGVKIGNVFGNKYKAKAEIVGGIILIIIGFSILLEHLEII